MQAFREPLPEAVLEHLGERGLNDEPTLVQVSSDLSPDWHYGRQWLLVTETRLLLIPCESESGIVVVRMEDVTGAGIDAFVGGGRLTVERRGAEPIYVPFSQSLMPKFSEVAEGIRQLSEGEELSLPEGMERSRCDRCRRLLPEKDGICAACISKWHTLRRLLRYLMARPWQLISVALLTLLTTALELLPPRITQHIIDDALVPGSDFNLLILLVLGLLGVQLSLWAASVVLEWLAQRMGHGGVQDIRSDLYRKLLFLPLRFYDRRTVGSLISRMSNDSDRLEGFLASDLPYFLSRLLLFTGILGLLLVTNWELTLLVLLPVPPIVMVGSRIWKRMMGYWTRWGVKWSRLSAHLSESITGIRVVKAFAQETRESDRFDRRNEDLRAVVVASERNWFVFFTVTNFMMSWGVFLVWYFGGRQILRGEMTLGALVAFISYLWMLYQPLRWFGELYNIVLRAFAGAERIFEVVDSGSEPYESADASPLPRMEGRIVFQDVDFGYDPGKPVLKGIDLSVRPGEMIGLVGRSGAGKSTLINLICRFYDPDRGRIEIDGLDTREVRLTDLRSQIGMVQQEPFLFDGTITENIAYGKQDATFGEVVQAAVAAEAHEFIVGKPDGYDMKVGEKGGNLSGGEKQRISIARAILHDPRILILDEATSSLDTRTERKIQKAISRLVEGRTTFAIAHRLSTLRSADRLIVLDDGRVAEVGTHLELMSRRGIFHRLVNQQKETTAVMAVGGGKDDSGKD